MIGKLKAAIKRGQRRIKQIVHFNTVRRAEIKRLRAEHNATVMYDSVALTAIPSNAPAVAGYTSGHWPTYWQLAKEFPHAWKLSIAVDHTHDADCLDIEAGDATPVEAPAWVKRQLTRGVKRPVVYSSVSQMPAVLAALKASGIKRKQVRIWTAHYTLRPHLCGPHSCGALTETTADATQWTDVALGRNLDESLLSSGFFT